MVIFACGMLFVFGILSVILIVTSYFIASKHRKRLQQLNAVPLVKGAGVAACAPGVAKMAGKVIAPQGTIKSPIGDRKCVYFNFRVEEEQEQTRTESTKDGPRTRTVKTWVPLINESRMTVCGVKDEDGA